jgi:DNA-binding MarR family transcriptional regulator
MNAQSKDQQSSRAPALAQDLRALLSKLKRRLREQGNAGDLTPSQVSVLLRLEKDGPATAARLARGEGMRPQSLGPVIAALEEAGLVSGAPDPNDGRQTLLSLTDACRKWAQEGRAAKQDWLTHAIRVTAVFPGTRRTRGFHRVAQAARRRLMAFVGCTQRKRIVIYRGCSHGAYHARPEHGPDYR